MHSKFLHMFVFFLFKSTTLLEGQDQARIIRRGLERIGIQEMLRSEGEDFFLNGSKWNVDKTGRKQNLRKKDTCTDAVPPCVSPDVFCFIHSV